MAPPLKAIPCAFIVLLSPSEGVTDSLLEMLGLAGEQKTNVSQNFGACKPQKWENGIHHDVMHQNSCTPFELASQQRQFLLTGLTHL